MGDADIDIYGDLCGDLPTGGISPQPADDAATLQVALPATQQPQVPVMSPPPGSPPAASLGGRTEAPGRGPQTWVAPGYEQSAYSGSFVVEGGEVVEADPATAEGERPRDFEALRQELVAREGPAPQGRPRPEGPGGAAEDESTDASDDEAGGAAIQLGEVCASKMGACPPRKWHRDAPELLAHQPMPREATAPAPLPLLPAGQSVGAAECFVLLGGLPPTLTAIELRRLAEQFGQLRAMRVLEDVARSGRSAGIAMLEYATADGAMRAAGAGDGLCALSAWPVMMVAPPRLVLVGRELLGMMRAGSPPWPDGGPCSEDLRCVLARQFEQWSVAARDGRAGRGNDESPRGGAAARQGSGQLACSEPERPRREEGWADKLKALKRKVNSKQDLLADAKRERA